MLIELEPAAEHVAATDVIVGIAGVTNIAALLNIALATEVQEPLLAVTV